MDPSTKSVTYLAPGALSSTAESAMRLPGANDPPSGPPAPWPDPDDRLVEPESRQEMWRGQLIHVSPATEEHGDTHTRLSRVIDLSTADGYITSTDLLTRRSEDSDFATDTSVRKDGDNPDTGTRYLEELSFEVFNTQSRAYAIRRARDIIHSGVRRLFGLFVWPAAPGNTDDSDTSQQTARFTVTVEEWSAEQDAWILRDPDEHIHDPCLLRPLPVKALIDATAADNACARSLIARRNPVIAQVELKGYRKGKDDGYQAGKDDGYQAGKDDGARALASSLLSQHFGELPDWASRRITTADLQQIQRWLGHLSTTASLEQLLGEER